MPTSKGLWSCAGHRSERIKPSAMLASLKPLQPSKPKPLAQTTAPTAKDSTTMPPPPVVVKHPSRGGGKAPPPVLTPPLPPPAKPPPTQQQPGNEQDSGKGPSPGTLPITKFSGGSAAAPASPKGRSTHQGQRPLISPKGRPPPTIAIPSQQSRQSGALTAAISSPRSVATEDTAYLEDKLERKREAKRQWAKAYEGGRAEEEDPSSINADLIITKKSIGRVEILDEESSLQGMNLHLQRAQMVTIGPHRLEDLDLEGRSAQGVIDLGHVVALDRGDVERAAHLTKGGDHAQIKEKMSISHPKIGEGEMTLLHHCSKRKTGLRTDLPNNLNHNLTKNNKERSHRYLNLQVSLHNCTSSYSTNGTISCSACYTTCTTIGDRASSGSGGQASPSTTSCSTCNWRCCGQSSNSQGNAYTATATRASTVSAIATTSVSTLIDNDSSPARPQAQQMATPPGLGTDLERTQAAQIHQMHQQMAQLEAQLRAVQAPATQRQSSHSPSGNWGWSDQAHQSQWHGHGWQDWGNGRGYQ